MFIRLTGQEMLNPSRPLSLAVLLTKVERFELTKPSKTLLKAVLPSYVLEPSSAKPKFLFP